MSWRPFASTWRNPAVVPTAVHAALVSMLTLGATVLPGSAPARPQAPRPAPPAELSAAGGRRRAARVPGRRALPRHEGLRGVARHARCLGAPGPAACRLVQRDIGEGAADVDRDRERRIRRAHRRTRARER